MSRPLPFLFTADSPFRLFMQFMARQRAATTVPPDVGTDGQAVPTGTAAQAAAQLGTPFDAHARATLTIPPGVGPAAVAAPVQVLAIGGAPQAEDVVQNAEVPKTPLSVHQFVLNNEYCAHTCGRLAESDPLS